MLSIRSFPPPWITKIKNYFSRQPSAVLNQHLY